jgi:cell division protein FtsW (lipid II flippase)
MRFAATLLVFCVGALLALGMVVLYSAGMMHGEKGAQYFLKQLTWSGVGMSVCLAAAFLNYRIFKKLSWFMLGVSVGLLVLVLLPGITEKTNGAHRWFNLGAASFQPSELAKLSLIAVLAWYGERYRRQMRTFRKGILIPGLIAGVTLGLIFVEPDVGTTVLLAAVASIMLLVAGIRWLHFLPPVCLAWPVRLWLCSSGTTRCGRIEFIPGCIWKRQRRRKDFKHGNRGSPLAQADGTGLGLATDVKNTDSCPRITQISSFPLLAKSSD